MHLLHNLQVHILPAHPNRKQTYTLIVLGFNDTSILVGHFVCLPEKGRKEIEETAEEMKDRDREDSRK